MSEDRILATYLIETPHTIERALDRMLALQSTGTFTAVPGETDTLKRRFAIEVTAVAPLDPVARPSLPSWDYRVAVTDSTQFNRAEVELSLPLALAETDLTTLMATVAGGIFGLCEFSGIRLLDMVLPQAFAEAHPGPQFGVAGTRKLTGVYDRPIIASIIKPNVGLTPEQTAAIVRELVEAGVDFIKDDEKMTSPAYSSLAARANAVMRIIRDHAERSGKKVMYAFNISSDDPETMVRGHDTVVAAGGTAVMVSIVQVGLAGVKYLRQRSQLPIHAHRNGWDALTRHPALGFDFRAWHQFYRLAGVDHIHVNGIGNKFWEDDASVIRSMSACLKPLFRESDRVLPVVGSGMWAGQVPATYALTGGAVDWLYIAGGGIQGHPAGPGAGVISIKQAWEATKAGVPLHDYAANHRELQQALERFAGKR